MNKKLFPILSAFLLLFSLIEKGQATETYVPKHRLPDSSSFPVAGDKCIISIRDGDFSKETFMARNPSTLTTVRGRLFPLLIR